MRSKTHIRLKLLRRLVQRPFLFLATDRKSLCLLEAREPGRMYSSHTNDDLKLVVFPRGNYSSRMNNQPMWLPSKGYYFEKIHPWKRRQKALLRVSFLLGNSSVRDMKTSSFLVRTGIG